MRVLVISNNSFSSIHNNGKTLKSIFRCCSRDNIAQLYFGTNEIPDESCCSSFYRVTELEIVKALILGKSTRNSHSDLINTLSTKTHSKPKESGIMAFLKKNSKSLSLFRNKLWSTGKWNSEELRSWIQAFNPDVIFAVLGDNLFVHRIALTLQKYYKLPLAIYFTDDYYLNDFSTNIFQRIAYQELRKQYIKTIKNADSLYVIGTKMAVSYENEFGRKFNILINSVEPEKFRNLKQQKIDDTKEIIFSYIGGVHLKRWKSIVRIGCALKSIKEFNTRLYVFCTSQLDKEIGKIFDQNGVIFCGGLDENGVLDQIEKSHFLIHAESFESVIRKYIHFSISTKIPEYLSSRREIVVFGPAEVASVEIFTKHSFGCILDENDTNEQLREKLLRAIKTYNLKTFEKEVDFATKHFNVNIVSPSFLKELQSLVNRNK